ncbi:hypothetical protein V6N12_065117 [Hibiscus sabdariffa]|uniref:Uncharacterized protein n=1 Tax=Hibiscus sabdariffa TaxID=183260 RepID=A0ABR2G7R9_9ROSI
MSLLEHESLSVLLGIGHLSLTCSLPMISSDMLELIYPRRKLSKHSHVVWQLRRSSCIAWSIGNGNIVHPLDNVWVLSLGPLRDHLVSPDSFSPAFSFSDLLDSEGNWDCGKLAEYFTIDAIPHILSIKSPGPMDTDDFIIWRWDPKHVFKTKLTYFRLASSSWDITNPI